MSVDKSLLSLYFTVYHLSLTYFYADPALFLMMTKLAVEISSHGRTHLLQDRSTMHAALGVCALVTTLRISKRIQIVVLFHLWMAALVLRAR